MEIYDKIEALQEWVRENMVRARDDEFMDKVSEMRKLMNEAEGVK